MDLNIPSAQSQSGSLSAERRIVSKRMIAFSREERLSKFAKEFPSMKFRGNGPIWIGLLLFCVSLIPTEVHAQLRNIQNIFDPLSKPAELIKETAVLTLLVCLAIFLIVSALLIYAVWRYRRKPTDDESREPPQVYGSTAIELAWTVPPILIVVLLVLATARTIGEIQHPKMPDTAAQVRINGYLFLWGV